MCGTPAGVGIAARLALGGRDVTRHVVEEDWHGA